MVKSPDRWKDNPFAEVEGKFKGVWRAAKYHYANRFGKVENWPPAHNVNIGGIDVCIEASNRRLRFEQNGVTTQVIFSDRDGSTAGLTVGAGDQRLYLSATILRQKIFSGDDNPETQFVWKNPEGNLIEARFQPDDHNLISYYRLPMEWETQIYEPWQKIKSTRGPRKNGYDLSWEVDSKFPDNLRGLALLDGQVLPWSIDIWQRGEEVIAASGIRNLAADQIKYYL